MQQKVVAIHQPNFLPWLGYFDKIVRSDVFIFLDNVQFPKTGGTWMNRVKMLVAGAATWVTVPVCRNFSGVRLVNEMQIDDQRDWRAKLLKTIHCNYKKAACFDEVFPVLEGWLHKPSGASLADYNIVCIEAMMERLNLDRRKLVRSSSLPSEGTGTDLLISLAKTVGGTVYMCGGGAAGYQEDAKFAAAGLRLQYQNYQHPVYPQVAVSGFVMGLSIVDAMMSLGFQGVGRLLRSAAPKGVA